MVLDHVRSANDKTIKRVTKRRITSKRPLGTSRGRLRDVGENILEITRENVCR